MRDWHLPNSTKYVPQMRILCWGKCNLSWAKRILSNAYAESGTCQVSRWSQMKEQVTHGHQGPTALRRPRGCGGCEVAHGGFWEQAFSLPLPPDPPNSGLMGTDSYATVKAREKWQVSSCFELQSDRLYPKIISTTGHRSQSDFRGGGHGKRTLLP